MVIKILKDAQLNGAEVPIYCCGVPWSPTKSHDSTQMVAPVQEFLMYLASSRASSLQISFTGGGRFLRILLRIVLRVYGRRSVSRVFNRKLYEHGIQSYFVCVLSIALSVASVTITSYSVASSLYAVLLTVLIIVHFDGTSIHSLHNMRCSKPRELCPLYAQFMLEAKQLRF